MCDDLLSVRGRGSLLKSLSQDSEYSLDSSLFDAEEFLRDMGFAGAADPSIPERFLPSLLQRLSRFPEAEMDSLHHRIVQSIGCFRRKEGKRRLFRNLSSGRTPHLPCPPASYPLLRSNTGPAAFPSSLPRDVGGEDDTVPHSPIAILVSAASTEESQFDSGQTSVDLEDSDSEEGGADPDDSGCFSVDHPPQRDFGSSKDSGDGKQSKEVDSNGVGLDIERTVSSSEESKDLVVESVVDRTRLLDEDCEQKEVTTTEFFSSHSGSETSLQSVSFPSVQEENEAFREIASEETVKSCSQNYSRSFHRPVERQNGSKFYFSELEAVSKGMGLLITDANTNPDVFKKSTVEQSETDNSDGLKDLSKDFKTYETSGNSFKSSSNSFSDIVMKATDMAREKLEQEKSFQDSIRNDKQHIDNQIEYNNTSNFLKYSISAKDSSDNIFTNSQECMDIPSNVNHPLTAKDYVDTTDLPSSKSKETASLIDISEYNPIGLQQSPTECSLDEIEILLSDMNMQPSSKAAKENLYLPVPNSVAKSCKENLLHKDELLNYEVMQQKLVKEASSSFLNREEKDAIDLDFSKAIKSPKNPIRTASNMSESFKEVASLDSAISSFGSFNSSSDGNIPVVVKHPLRRTSNSNNFYFNDSYPFELSSDRDSKEIKEIGEWSSLKTSLRSSLDDVSANERSKSEDPVSDSDSAAECLTSIKSFPSHKQKCTKEDSLTSFLSSMLDTTGKKSDIRKELSVENGTVKAIPNRKRRVLKRMSSSMQCCDEDDCRHHDGLPKDDSSELKHEETHDGNFANILYPQITPSLERQSSSSDTAGVLPKSSPEGWYTEKNFQPNPKSCVEEMTPKLALRNTNSTPLTSEAKQSTFKVNFSAKSSDFFRRKDKRPCKRRRYLSCPSPNNFNFVPKFHMNKLSSSLRDIHSPECYKCQEFNSFSDGFTDMSSRPRPGFYSPRGCSPVRKLRSSDPPWSSSFPSRLSSGGHYLYDSSPDIHGTVSPELVRTIPPRYSGTSASNEVFHQNETCRCHCDSTRKAFRFPLRQNSMSCPDSEAPFDQQCLDRCCSPLLSKRQFASERHRRSEFSDFESHFRNDSMFLNKCQNLQKQQIIRKISAPDYPRDVCQYHSYSNYPKIAQNDSRADVTHQPSCLNSRSFLQQQQDSPLQFDIPFLHNTSTTLSSCRPIRQNSDVLDCRCRNCTRELQSWRFSNLRDNAPSGHSEASRQYRTSDVFCERERFSSGHFPSESLLETPYKVASHSDSEVTDCSLSKNSFCKDHKSNQFSWDGFPRRRNSRFEHSNTQAKDIFKLEMNSSERALKSSDPPFKFTSQVQQNRTSLSNFEKPLSVCINTSKNEPTSAPVKHSNPFDFEHKNLNYSQFEAHLMDDVPRIEPTDITQNLSRTETKRISGDVKNLKQSFSEERSRNYSEPKASLKNSSQDHNSECFPQQESGDLLQILPKHTILKRSISEHPPPSLSCNDHRSKSSPPSPDNKREAMFEKKIRIFSKFLTNLGNLSKSAAPGIKSLSSSLPDNSCVTVPPGGNKRQCATPPPVLNFPHPPMFENRVNLEVDGGKQSFQPVLYTSTVSLFVNGEEDDLTRKRDASLKTNSKSNSPQSSPMPFNVVSKELEDLQISIQKAKEMRLSASKELHLLQALLSRENHTKEKRCESSLENSERKGFIQMQKSETLQELKDRPHRKDQTEDAAYWQGEVERARKETEEAWAEKLSRMSAQLSLQEAELQRLQKGISTESLQDAVLCPQCNANSRAADTLHHNGRTDSAFEDDEEYKPSIPIQSTRQECERLRERLDEEEQRADQLNLMLNQKIIEFNKLQLTLSKQTKEMIELEKSYLQLQCRMRRGSHRPRLCSREGLTAARGQPSPHETPQN